MTTSPNLARRTARACRALGAAVIAAALVAAAPPLGGAPASAAAYLGSAAALPLNAPVVGLAAHPGGGYWLVASDGGIFSFGGARFFGSTGALVLNQPIVGMAATPTGNGYWLVASDGGIFSFGDARFQGSAGGSGLTAPVVGMATAPGGGYWLATAAGQVIPFGAARNHGSAVGLDSPVVGIASAGDGYYLAERDGDLHAFGAATRVPSARAALVGVPAQGVTASPGGGVWLSTSSGAVVAVGAAGVTPDPHLAALTREQRIASEVFDRVNAERRARGLGVLVRDAHLDLLAQQWAAHLAATHTFVHRDLGATLRSPGFAGRYQALSENLFAGDGYYHDAGSAHVALMHSDGHRHAILAPHSTSVGVGVVCAGDTLYVVENFGTWAGLPTPPFATPPRDPIARPDETGASC